MTIKPNPKRMRPLQDFPVPCDKNVLRCVLGMFVYYARWIDSSATNVRCFAEAKAFPLTGCATVTFVSLKSELHNSALQSVDKSLSFVVECNAFDVAMSATLNQGDYCRLYVSDLAG